MEKAANKKITSKIFEKHEICIAVALLILICLFSLHSPRFFSVQNFRTILNQITMVFVIAVGMTIVIILGGIDLSAGNLSAFTGMIVTYLLSNGTNVVLAVVIGLCVGMAIGFLNGFLITKIGITDFIVTLAMMSALRGGIFSVTGGYPIHRNIPDSFRFIGQGTVFQIPLLIIIAVIVFIVGHLLLTKFTFGTYVYATGGNKESARLSGVNVDLIKIIGYVTSGLTASMAGIMMSSRLGSGQPTAGDTFLFDAIGATVLGGTSLSGGSGMLIGTAIGVCIIGVISNGLTIMNVSFYYQEIIKGAIIILAVSYNAMRMKNKG